MTNALTIPDQAWFALKEGGATALEPLKRTIPLGEYDVLGLVHMDNPGVHFRSIRQGSKLSLACPSGVCEVVKGGITFGRLPPREGAVFNCLLRGGKKLVAKVVSRSCAGLEPELRVEVELEEF